MAGAELWQLPDQDLADSIAELETVLRRAEFERLRLLAEFAGRGVAGREAGLSTEAFLRARLRLSRSEAARWVHAARELADMAAQLIRI